MKAKPETKGKASKPKAADSEEFTVAANLRRQGKKVGTMKLDSEGTMYWLRDRLELPVEKEEFEEAMKKILETSLLNDSEAGRSAHKAWRYGEVFLSLWEALKKLATDAENPNVRSGAGRILATVIHEIGTRQGKAWIEATKKANKAFEEKLVPFPGRFGGKPPKADLVRWVNNHMDNQSHLWPEAMEVAQRVGPEKYETLEQSWAAWYERHRSSPNGFVTELDGHFFTATPFEVLADFEKLWDAGLKELLHKEWEVEKLAGTLKISGECNFIKRFGDVKHPEGGYHLAKRSFVRYWWPRWELHLKSEKEFEEAFQRNLAKFRETHPNATAGEFEGAMLEIFLREL